MKFSVFQVSRRGGRARNEDRMGYSYTREAGLFVVADGMGGHPQGDVAAAIALETLDTLFQRKADPRLSDPRGFLDEAVLQAHRRMLEHADRHAMPDSPRTTVVACVVQDGCATWAHCGDSRLYLVRDGDLLLRTRDHSYAERPRMQASSGQMVNRNVLFTCLGSPSRPMVDMSDTTPLHDGDRVLLCSDGLWGALADREIVSVLGAQVVSDSVPTLVERALRAAGSSSDNVTAVAFEWECVREDGPNAGAGPAGSASDSPADGTARHDHHELDEDAIERSIAEINEAIRRTALRNGA
ncbi:SpoIIE family protein phosphatase [Xylophilus sp. Kf1]|nr:SpoIIE family protein phosphatase [Xylophilus sp. Kf1]